MYLSLQQTFDPAGWAVFSALSGLHVDTAGPACPHIYTRSDTNYCTTEKVSIETFHTKSKSLTELMCCVCVLNVSAQAVFGRGISAVRENFICVGEYNVRYSRVYSKHMTELFSLPPPSLSLSLPLQVFQLVQSSCLMFPVKAVI